jgi:hypothetical protein
MNNLETITPGYFEELRRNTPPHEVVHQNGAGVKDVWSHRQHVKDFMAHAVSLPEGIVSDLIFPGGITSAAAPSGSGKTVFFYILIQQLVTGGIFRGEKLCPSRILLCDYDNPVSLVQKRIKSAFSSYDVDFQIMERGQSPQLLDKKAWKSFPANEHNVVVIDSFGSAAVGVSEKEGAKLQQALDTLKMIADKGPAVVVLENTNKSGASYRGRGEKVERVDIFYEVRDITDWTPHRKDCWWEDIPTGDHAAWQGRASRRNRRQKMRIVLTCTKFRWGEEPEPFALEIDFSNRPWSVSDVTEEIEKVGQETSQSTRDKKQRLLLEAAIALSNVIQSMPEGSDPMSRTEAVEILKERGLKRDEARNILDAHDAEVFPAEGRWRLREVPGSRGKKIGVYPV